MTLGQNIARLRAQKSLSQGDLADALEVSRQSVSKWETDASIPELDKLLRLAELFGVTLDELVKGESAQPEAARGEAADKGTAETASTEGAGAYTAAVPAPQRETRKIVGTILLCFGALIGILIVFLTGTFAGFILALPLFVCGAICLAVRRRTGLWCAWALYLLVELYLRYATGLSWSVIRYTLQWTAEMNYIRLIVAWAQALYLLMMLLCTLRSYRTLTLSGSKKQLAWFAVLWLAFFAVGGAQSVWIRWLAANSTFISAFDPRLYAADHLLPLVRIGLFAAILVFTAALWRGWRQRRSGTE